jgi:hypothetical protein
MSYFPTRVTAFTGMKTASHLTLSSKRFSRVIWAGGPNRLERILRDLAMKSE